MDPNTVLTRIRELIQENYVLGEQVDYDQNAAVRILFDLTDAVEVLDQWLTGEGFLPGDWSQNRASTEERAQWAAEREHLLDNHANVVEELADERDQYMRDYHHAVQERDELRADLNGVRWERGQLESDLTQLRWDHDDLERDHAALTRERDELARQLSYAESQLSRYQYGGAW